MSSGWSNQPQSVFTQGAAGVGYDEGLRQHMVRLFYMVAGGIAVAGLAAFMTVATPLGPMIYGTGLRFAVAFAPLIMLMVISFQMNRLSLGALHGWYWAFTAVMGVSLAYVFYIYSGQSLARVFFITAGTFAGSALIGYTTKRDLTSMGSFLMMGLLGIILASVVNIFMHSSAIQFGISVLGVLIFTGLTAFDAQQQKRIYLAVGGGEMAQRASVMGALGLFINFVNLFQMLLSLLGNRN